MATKTDFEKASEAKPMGIGREFLYFLAENKKWWLLPIVVMLVVIVLVRIATPTPAVVEVRAVTRYWHPTLFNRPPPAGC